MSVNWSLIKPLILVVVILIYWVIGYYPLRSPPGFYNGAILSADDGLQFPSAGIADTYSGPDWLVDAINSSSYDITLDVQPLSVEQSGPARILTITANYTIIVGQEGEDLTVRFRSPDKILNGMRKFVVSDVFDNLDRHIILIRLKPEQLVVVVNDVERLTAILPDYRQGPQMHHYHLTLGNKFTYDRPWLGVIREAVLHANERQVDYLKTGALELSVDYYQQLLYQKINPVPFYRKSYSIREIQDWSINLFGFIPLGLLWVILYPGWCSIWRITIICFGVSLVIEITQILLPWRSPGLDDLILNTLGGAAGAWLGIKYWSDRRTRQ